MQPWRPYRGPLVARHQLPVLLVKVDLPAPHRRSLGPWTCRGSWRVSPVTAMLQPADRRDDKDLLQELRRPPPRHELRTGEAREKTRKEVLGLHLSQVPRPTARGPLPGDRAAPLRRGR